MSAGSALIGAAVHPRRRDRLIRKVAGYSAIRASAEGLLGIRGILLATLLGPAAFGSWALLRLGTRYATLAGLGVFRGLEVELLHSRDRAAQGAAQGAADRSEAAGAALGFVLAVSGALATIALLLSALVAAPNHRLILQGFAAAVVAESVYGYVLVFTRVRTTLLRYALLEACTAALHLGLGVILAWRFGLAGAFAGLAIAATLGAAAASRWVEMRPVLRSSTLRPMLKVGLPLALTGVVGTLLHTADRWVVAAWGGEELLGYYAFAGALASAAAAFALAIRTVVFPEVYGEARRAGAATALRRHLDRSLMPFATLVPPFLGAIGFCIGPVVALALNLGLSTVALLAGAGLEGVAAASLVGHLIFAAAVVRLNARLSGIARAGRLAVRALRPLVWCAAAVVIAGHAAAGLGSEVAGLGLYLFLVLPLAVGWRSEWRRVRGER